MAFWKFFINPPEYGLPVNLKKDNLPYLYIVRADKNHNTETLAKLEFLGLFIQSP
jgi:hypothetical protein